jgi:hypothetical protein
VFNRNRPEETHPLDETITNLISEFAGSETSEEEAERAAIIKTFWELRAADKLAARRTLSPDMIAAITANLLGIGMILGFEKANVLTSKSLSLIPKIRI